MPNLEVQKLIEARSKLLPKFEKQTFPVLKKAEKKKVIEGEITVDPSTQDLPIRFTEISSDFSLTANSHPIFGMNDYRETSPLQLTAISKQRELMVLFVEHTDQSLVFTGQIPTNFTVLIGDNEVPVHPSGSFSFEFSVGNLTAPAAIKLSILR